MKKSAAALSTVSTSGFSEALLACYPLAALEAARNILCRLGNHREGEKVCFVSDEGTRAVGDLFVALATEIEVPHQHLIVKPFAIHGQEPPPEVASEMAASDLVLGLTHFSMAHTRARQTCSQRGVRYLSMPEYSLELLQHPSLRIDFQKSAQGARRLADALTAGKQVRVVSPAGTDIELGIAGRTGNFCPGYVDEQCLLGSPPDIEANVSPEETKSNGRVVVDGSIPYPGFGRLEQPLTLEVRGGKINKIDGPKAQVAALEKLFAKHGEKARVLAEFGIGFNEAAKLCGNMLIDEGCRGTFHFGFGSNSTVGGQNVVNFHLDFIFYASQFQLDGELVTI